MILPIVLSHRSGRLIELNNQVKIQSIYFFKLLTIFWIKKNEIKPGDLPHPILQESHCELTQKNFHWEP